MMHSSNLQFFPVPFLAGVGILFISMIFLNRKVSSPVPYRFCYLVFVFLFGLYLLDAARLTIFPIALPASFGDRSSFSFILSRINLIPLNFGGMLSLSRGVIFENLAGNLILTLPFGFGIHFVSQRKSRITAGQFLWLSFLPGLVVEFTQLVVSLMVGVAYRGVDINDVLLNALGAWMGYAFFRIFAWLLIVFAGRKNLTPKGIVAYIFMVARPYRE
jgi:glycopeptide antibiotics resistance protein